MFRDKNFLIEKGLYPNSRDDVFFIMGSLYDDFIIKEKYTIEDKSRIESIRQYLENNRGIIAYNDYDICAVQTIINRFNDLRRKENIKENELIEEKEIINEEHNDWEDKTGIYGIYIDDKLIYIGKTTVSFKDRFKTHKRNMDNNNDSMYIYKLLKDAKNNKHSIQMRPIIILENLQMIHKKHINSKELNCMELALITAYNPIGNIEGRLKPYTFRNN